MLDHDYIQSIREQLVKKFLDKINGLNEHELHVFVDEDVDTGLISYKPYWLDNHNDNDGKVMPLRDRNVLIIAKASHGRWTKLINNQLIQGQRFTDNKFLLNFDYRSDNALSNYGAKKLREYLKKTFAVDLTSDGLLVAKCLQPNSFIDAFTDLIDAIRYVSNNGYDYIKNKEDMLNATKELRFEQDSIKSADHAFQVAKRKHAGKSTHRKKKFTLGKVSKGNSSVYGTTRDPKMKARYRREAKQRAKIKKMLSGGSTKQSAKSKPNHKASKQSTATPKPKQSVTIKNHYFATVGKFSISRSKLVQTIKNQGGHVQSSVNGKTDYLVCDKPSKSKKYQTAVKKHIPIIKESDL